MKFSAATLAVFLLPVLSLASPIAEADSVESDLGAPLLVSEKRSEGEIFARKNTACKIINVDTVVNCRSGPGTGYGVVGQSTGGATYTFSCYKRGTCVSGNCTWDYLPEHSCYISGYYTSAACSIANLGPC